VQLGAQGATVIVHGRDFGRGVAMVKEIENAGGSARFVGADLGEPAKPLPLATEVGDVDILVNNAGFAWFGATQKLAANTLAHLFAANVQAPYLLVSVLAPKMAARGHGVIINVASRPALSVSPQLPPTAPPKRPWPRWPAPGPPSTDPPASASTPSRQDRSTPTQPSGRCSIPLGETTVLGRAGEPQEVADLIDFLASPEPPTSPVPTFRSTAVGDKHRRHGP
jgi:NAD(P)-dependent dehydrogenase (short-subunit alcohol dehydrogenase family)